MPRTHALISCFYDSKSNSLPVGFDWIKTLASDPYKDKYIFTMLLHGDCLKYGFNSKTYRVKFGTPNPHVRF